MLPAPRPTRALALLLTLVGPVLCAGAPGPARAAATTPSGPTMMLRSRRRSCRRLLCSRLTGGAPMACRLVGCRLMAGP